MKKILCLIILIWGLLAPLTYHPDTKLTLRYPALENGKVWNIYSYLNDHNLDIPDFHYPPAHYWWLKIHYPISKFIAGNGFDEWLASGSAQASFDLRIMQYNLATKLPLLILGLFSGWLIFKIVWKYTNSVDLGKKAALFWYLNPITLYSLVAMGQNDIVAIALFLLGIYLIDRWWLTALVWGLASGVKNYPIIWSLIFLFVWEKKIVKLIFKSASVVLVYFLIMLPWLGKDYFVEAVLNSGLSQRMFIANIPLGFGKEILIVPFLLVFLAIKSFSKKKTINNIALVLVQTCLIILAFSHFNPQWMLWLMPFLSILLFTEKPVKKVYLPLITIFVSWLILALGFDDRFLTWGLLTPVTPNLINFPSLVELARNKGFDISTLINLAQTILAGTTIWFLGRKTKTIDIKNNKIHLKKWWLLIPWFFWIILIVGLNNFKVQKRIDSKVSGKIVLLSELNQNKWSYDVENGLKYLEFSLDKVKDSSNDKGVLLVRDNSGNEIEKGFTAYNATPDSWLRVDIPEKMSKAKSLEVELKEIVDKDQSLKMKVDDNNRLAINFFSYTKTSIKEIGIKLSFLWWWWTGLVLISFVYIKIKED